MSSPFDMGVISEDSPTSDSEDSRGPEGEMGSGDGVPEENRKAESDRKLAELSGQVEAVLSENARLRAEAANPAAPPEPEKERFEKEQLKAHAMQEDGKLQFDAGVVYTDQKFEDFDQKLESFKDSFVKEMKQSAADLAVGKHLGRIAPGLDDPNSELNRKITARTDQLLREDPALAATDAGRQRARELALLDTVRTTPGVPVSGESAEAFAIRRRLESSAAAGVGGRGLGNEGGNAMGGGITEELTEEHLRKARVGGSKIIDDPDPVRRKIGRAALLKFIQKRDQMGQYGGGPFSGELAQRRSTGGVR